MIAGYAGAVIVNTTVVACLVQILVSTPLKWIDIVPGAAFTGMAWTALQGVGSWYTRGLVDRADKTYGTFAVVIGLLSWIFLQSQAFIYGAELSVVRSSKMWPRSLVD